MKRLLKRAILFFRVRRSRRWVGEGLNRYRFEIGPCCKHGCEFWIDCQHW